MMKIPVRALMNTRSSDAETMVELYLFTKQLMRPVTANNMAWKYFKDVSTVRHALYQLVKKDLAERYKEDREFYYSLPPFDEPTVEIDPEIALKTSAFASYCYGKTPMGKMLDRQEIKKCFDGREYQLDLMIHKGYIKYEGTAGTRTYYKVAKEDVE